MLTPDTVPAPQAAAVTAPYRVDVSRGQVNGSVSSQWHKRPADQRFLSLDDLFAKTQNRAAHSHAEIIDSKAVKVVARREDPEKLQLELPSGVVANPSHWSFGQLCTLVKAPAGYLRTLPGPIAGANLQWGLVDHRAEQLKTYTTDEGDFELRAVTGPDYGRIFDHEVVGAVMKIAAEGQWKIPGKLNWANGTYDPFAPVTLDSTTLYGSDRDVFIFMVDDLHPIEIGKLKNGDPDLVFRGFYAWNSEVGSASAGIASMYLRGACENRNLWGVEGFQEITIRHSKSGPARFANEAIPALQTYAMGNPTRLIAGVQSAKEAIVAKTDEERLDFLTDRNFSRKQAGMIIDMVLQEEGHPAESIFDFVQGMTAFARDIPNQDERVAVERAAGRLFKKAA